MAEIDLLQKPHGTDFLHMNLKPSGSECRMPQQPDLPTFHKDVGHGATGQTRLAVAHFAEQGAHLGIQAITKKNCTSHAQPVLSTTPVAW